MGVGLYGDICSQQMRPVSDWTKIHDSGNPALIQAGVWIPQHKKHQYCKMTLIRKFHFFKDLEILKQNQINVIFHYLKQCITLVSGILYWNSDV